MKRRVLLGALPLAFAGCLSHLPGASGPRNPPQEPENNPRDAPEKNPLVVGDFRFEESDGGKLQVLVAVTNRTDAERSGTVVGSLTLKGEEYTAQADATVAGGEKTDVTLRYGTVDYETYDEAKSFNFSASIE